MAQDLRFSDHQKPRKKNKDWCPCCLDYVKTYSKERDPDWKEWDIVCTKCFTPLFFCTQEICSHEMV